MIGCAHNRRTPRFCPTPCRVGSSRIDRHRQYLKELKESGRDTEAAEKFLLELERTQKVFERDLAALEKQR